MEHWPQPSIPPVKAEDGELSRSSRVLTVTSSNVQACALDTKDGIENRDPASNTALGQDAFKSASAQHHSQALASNHHQENLNHLDAQRQRHRNGTRRGVRPHPNSPRPYLTCEKYLKYKNRQRIDSGKDGARVWDPVTEEAFQEALVQIIPMGRKKRTQNGKVYGRNELIAEYIYQRTGAKRDRKQVSSHIQVLNKPLKGIPEWDAVTKASDDTNNPNKHQYYDASIRNMDHGRNHGSRLVHHPYLSSAHHNGLPPPAFTLGSNSDHVEKHCVAKLSFVMWVSPPNPTPPQMTDQLHRYTEVQCCDSSSQPAPLENTKNWRLSFPHLPSILEHTSLFQCCDVILLEASFRLMPDFPPPMCKLGINLELDFRHAMADMKALNELHGWKWICVTRLYEHGKCFQHTHRRCDLTKQKMEVGKVAPSFESKYWAEKFVNLIEKKRGAEDSGNEAAISAANEKSRNFFSGLSAMQELVAYAPHEVPLLETQVKPPQGKRMTILLWKFSQAQADHVGITTWQRLIPPPHRNTMNSPPSAHDPALPPLTMDTMVENMRDDSSFPTYKALHNQQSEQTPYHFYETNFDEHINLISHAGYDISFRDEDMSNLNAMHSSYDMPTTYGDFSQSSFSGLEHFPFDYPHQITFLGEHNTPRHSTNNFFESQQGHYSSQHEQPVSGLLVAPPAYQVAELSRHETAEEQEAHRQPLSNFDHSTHKMLQAQLEQGEARDHDAEEKTLQAALAAASAMNDLGAQNHPHFSYSHQQQHSREQENHWEIPFTPRPPLPHYSSYTTQHSHHSGAEEHLMAAMNQEAFAANELASAFQSHNSNFGASINNFDNDNEPVPLAGDYNFPTDLAAAFAHEITVKAEETDLSAEL